MSLSLASRRGPTRGRTATDHQDSVAAPREQPRVLVIDDDPDLLEALQELLELRGFAVCVATDLRSALEEAASHSPSAALIDVKLGKENGLDAIPELKRIQPQMCCLVLTAYRDAAYAKLAFELGADDFLFKPIEPGALIRSLVARLSASE